jgi:hypothetical protein
MDILFINRFGVYHWSEYIFEDNSSKDKFWISLTCKINQKEYYAILPTSKVDKYKFRSTDTYIIQEGTSRYFQEKTLLDFNKIKINKQQEIEKAFKNNKFKYLGLLEKSIQYDIENIILNAQTLSQNMINTLLCK